MKMDPKLVADKQAHEINYIATAYNIPVKVVKKTVDSVGRSRRKIYEALRLMGYVIDIKRGKRK